MMHAVKAQGICGRSRRKQHGFSVVQMIRASSILMVGIVSVVQLVPASLQSSVGNRMDTLATVIAQRELDQMLSQPLTADTFLDRDGQMVNLTSGGAAVVMSGPSVLVDFSADQPASGFYIPAYVDVNDPSHSAFELRWAVFPQVNNGTVVAKRIIIGCRRGQTIVGGQLFLPVTLDSSVQK